MRKTPEVQWILVPGTLNAVALSVMSRARRPVAGVTNGAKLKRDDLNGTHWLKFLSK